jgi:hypothetical protein
MSSSRLRSVRRVAGPVAATLMILVAAAAALHLQGRHWMCTCGRLYLWTSDAWGPDNSQHLLDPYSLTHVLHGVVLWWALALPAGRLAGVWRGLIALGLEAGWEVFENSAFVIDRYRDAAALGYTGDTVVNSLGDMVCCVAGVAVARQVGWRWSAALLVGVEAALLLWIRDSLVLNVTMLVYPIEAVKAWQLGH